MTDKVQKIKDWISKEQDGLMDAQGNFEYPEHEGAYHILCNLYAYIDSLQEEPVSEDLEEAANNHAIERYRTTRNRELAEKCKWSFKTGAKWQKAKDEYITKDLGQYISELAKQFPEVSFAKLSRIAVRVANWQKDKMIQNAIDAQCFGFQGAALFSFRLPADNYLVGSKVKVIVIKED